MKKNNMGFFLAETIVVVALVTTVMAFVYPNVSKLYDTYKNKAMYYDQTEDVFLLNSLKERLEFELINLGENSRLGQTTIASCNGYTEIGTATIPDLKEINIEDFKVGEISKLYIIGYIETPTTTNDYLFDKYLRRLVKATYDTSSYRLVAKFEKYKNGEVIETRYASIKIDNPNANRHCNLGG